MTTRRDFLRGCAALAGVLALPTEVLRGLDDECLVLPPRHWSCRSTALLLTVGDTAVGQAVLRRGPRVLLYLVAGRHSFGRWSATRGDAIVWSPDLRLAVSAGAVAALPFQDRVLFASDVEQRWVPLNALKEN